jgi:hypothetical protein
VILKDAYQSFSVLYWFLYIHKGAQNAPSTSFATCKDRIIKINFGFKAKTSFI